MRARILLTADDGKTYQAEFELTSQDNLSVAVPRDTSRGETDGTLPKQIDLRLALRPFMKRYGSNLSGPKRFALLVAHLAQKDLPAGVSLKEVARQWNKMKPLMGGAFNAAYSARAREDGWVDTVKVGMYTVCANWREILQ